VKKGRRMIPDCDLKLPLHLRDSLKEPFGVLVEGEHPETSLKIKGLIATRKPAKVVVVGDVATDTLLDVGVEFDVSIVDGKTLRTVSLNRSLTDGVRLNLKNPPGTISKDAWRVIREAYSKTGRVYVVVDGEEDLLAIPAIILAPEGAIIIYGQPKQGLVVLDVNDEARRRAISIVREMMEEACDGSESCL